MKLDLERKFSVETAWDRNAVCASRLAGKWNTLHWPYPIIKWCKGSNLSQVLGINKAFTSYIKSKVRAFAFTLVPWATRKTLFHLQNDLKFQFLCKLWRAGLSVDFQLAWSHLFGISCYASLPDQTTFPSHYSWVIAILVNHASWDLSVSVSSSVMMLSNKPPPNPGAWSKKFLSHLSQQMGSMAPCRGEGDLLCQPLAPCSRLQLGWVLLSGPLPSLN